MKKQIDPAPVNLGPTPRRAEGLREFPISFGVSYDSAIRRAKEGKLKTIWIGGRRLVPADEIERIAREGL
jgi:hypothetical protein